MNGRDTMKEHPKKQEKKNMLEYGRGGRSPSLPSQKDERKADPPVGPYRKRDGKKQISRP